MRNLFEKTTIGNMKIKNRFMRSATWGNMATKTGHMTEELYKVYEELAKGEVGLIITGYANVVREEQPNPGMIGIYEDSFIEEYKKLTSLVHKYDSKIVLQVAYGGTKTKFNVGERIIFAPSDVEERGTGTKGKEMTKDDINYIVEAFGESARRAKESGFDGIEIHGAHTYLINQFLSPYYNRRCDEYGGSLENRMRFLKEIYYKMREKVGEDYPILVKLTATDFFEGGLTFEETRVICKEMEKIGIDAIELSGNVHGKAKGMVGEKFDNIEIKEEGYFLGYGEIVAKEVNVPIITVGGFTNLDRIESILNNTDIEYFAISRPLLAEPHLIRRWKEGDVSPAKCIRCSKCRTPEGNHCVVFKESI
ncbi:NADH:flavin oxidoreductase [Hathewaya limosa]|uniref:2,4-dienoyl-CoA reductase-like NADH-dependent reductase (Old Yellow Enzyme family) n=1 Tax=Hathewaya limosa TaxID=1536 RepID=A0ABU0JS20_HATLI|nr:NADH:flavin oxidoreductase [Hathewaya limosa]MDQ0479897.1 2,4-dienoyl-CoA reductase-like NADH-dependent reductase (Old Yellow Enzyme family) [Hathewaya limosa]